MAALSGKLTKNLVRSPGHHGDGTGLYLVVDPSGARRWIVRVTVKGQRNREGKPLRTDFGLGGADVVTLNEARPRFGIQTSGKTGYQSARQWSAGNSMFQGDRPSGLH